MYMGIYNLQKNIFECVKVDGEYVFFFVLGVNCRERMLFIYRNISFLYEILCVVAFLRILDVFSFLYTIYTNVFTRLLLQLIVTRSYVLEEKKVYIHL